MTIELTERELLLLVKFINAMHLPGNLLWLLLWLFLCPLCHAEPILLPVPQHCKAAINRYYHREFSWEDAYAHWQEVLNGQPVLIDGCRIALDTAQDVPEDTWKLPTAILSQVDVWYAIEPHRDRVRAAIESLLDEGWGELEINRQHMTVRAQWQ